MNGMGPTASGYRKVNRRDGRTGSLSLWISKVSPAYTVARSSTIVCPKKEEPLVTLDLQELV